MNIEERIVNESLNLSNAYFPYYFERYPRSRTQVYNKYKQYFIKAASMFCVRDYYNPKKLIKSFMMDGFKYPQQLPIEKVWKTYLEYLPNIPDEKPEDIQIAEKIVNACIELRRYNGVSDFLSKKINQLSLFKNKLKFDIMILTFSKTFEDFYNEHYKEFEYEIDFDMQRHRIFKLENGYKIINKIKDFFKSDYFDYSLQEELNNKGFVF